VRRPHQIDRSVLRWPDYSRVFQRLWLGAPARWAKSSAERKETIHADSWSNSV